ncbi:hypothetical protein UA08_07467 [Talaromyces atroroseus]|uniref:N-acetyltransferase domain-containing protein n=1 Tax=Talaromyces atroroseus TaxID=1441469 RepID=A0A225AUI7_TALAT|nr:hypothetical protein UA08_07467 [Talaromyces atroroseus]OKL57137.1 hypothetical protein UA08_07467 [Talaromyces atroroseus]
MAELAIRPYDNTSDLAAVSALWQQAVPKYPISPQHLEELLVLRWGSHFVALIPNTDDSPASPRIIGFVATYTDVPGVSGLGSGSPAYLPVIIIHPGFQGKGHGTKLLQHAKDHLGKSFETIKVTSSIPRFWSGVPTDLSLKDQEFFAKRGFKETSRVKDFYQPLATFKSPQHILDRAASNGITFAPLTASGAEECLAAQELNFPRWAPGYQALHRGNHHEEIMVAFDRDGRQVGWTFILSPGKTRLWDGFAFVPVVGGEDGVSGNGRTAMISAVGVSKDVRGMGAGLGMVCAAMEEFKKRGGIDGVFVDQVVLDNFYEKVGETQPKMLSNKTMSLVPGLVKQGPFMRAFLAASAIARRQVGASRGLTTSSRRYASLQHNSKQTLSVLEQQRLRRPVAPHLTIYKWRYQSLTSILQRFSGIFLSGGLYLFAAGYLLAPLLVPQTAIAHLFDINTIAAFVGAWPVWAKVSAKFTLVWPFTFHAFNGVKQLVFDAGRGLTSRPGIVKASRAVAAVSFVSALALAFI